MNELVKIEINEQQQQVVSMRSIYERLEIVKPFTQWFEQQANRLGLVEGQDFLTCRLESSGGRPGVDFMTSTDIAKNICLMSQGAKAQEIRGGRRDEAIGWHGRT